MSILLILLVPALCLAAPSPEVLAARESIKSLIAPLLSKKNNRPKGTENFRVDTCEKHKINWKEFLTFQSSLTMSFTFKEGCDIQGTVSPAFIKPFPASLDVRNLMDFSHVDTQNKITGTLEKKPIMTLEMRDGKLTGKKGKVRFEADYQVLINPLNRENPIEKNLGGELRIHEIYGMKVSIKEKIMIE